MKAVLVLDGDVRIRFVQSEITDTGFSCLR